MLPPFDHLSISIARSQHHYFFFEKGKTDLMVVQLRASSKKKGLMITDYVERLMVVNLCPVY